MKVVTLKQANQEFSSLIRDVEAGETLVITRRGKPVARLSRYTGGRTDDPEWQAAYEEMCAAMEKGFHLGGLTFDREELYERDGPVHD